METKLLTDFKDFKKMLMENYTKNVQFYSNRIDKGRLLCKNELISYLKPNFFRASSSEEELEDGYALLVSLKKGKNVRVLRINVV